MFLMILKKLTSLRTKMLLALSLGMILLFSLIFLVARTSLLNGYAKLENEKAIIQLDGALNALEEQSYQLSLSASDNAHWDDMYKYADKPDPAFVKSGYGDEVNVNLKLNAIIIVNNQDELLYKNGFSYATKQPWPIPAGLIQAVSKGGVLVDPTKTSTSGLFSTAEGVFIVSASDILDSNNKGPRKGTFIVVRLLDDILLARVEKVLNTKISVKVMSDDEISSISPQLKTGKVVKALNDTQLAGYSLLTPINADNKLVLRVIGDREIFKLGESSLKFLYWSAALAALLLVIFSWLFDKLVLRKLALLNKNVTRIGLSATSTGRVEVLGGNDEITSLAHGINSMLTELDEAKHELQFEKERAQVTLSSIADAVITSDINSCVLYMNTAAERLTGIDAIYARGKPLSELFDLMTADKTTSVNSLWLTNPCATEDEVLLARADGQEFTLSKSASSLYDANANLFGTVTVLHDVTVLRRMSNQLSHQARFDALTGLSNRYEFDRRAKSAIEDARTSSLSHCIAYIDLDKFKLVNDTSGHMAGDIFLKKLADHMLARLRNSDTLARLGGDEFALLLMGCSLNKAQQIAGDLLESIQAFRFEYDNKVFKVGASIGLTEISPNKILELNTILGAADSACYSAKRAGGNNVHTYQSNDNNM